MTKPFPWNPHGFIRPSVEHLFRPPEPKRKGAAPGTMPAPGPKSQFTIGKSNMARTTKISKARI